MALIRTSFEHYEKWCLKCPKHLIFYYVVWAGRTLVQMWFGNYFVWSAAKLTMENFKVKKLVLNYLWNLLQIYISDHNLFSNKLNEQLTACLRKKSFLKTELWFWATKVLKKFRIKKVFHPLFFMYSYSPCAFFNYL